MTPFEEKRLKKIERFKNLAIAHRTRAEKRHLAYREISDRIPMGQPILVGHHSEARHRKDIKRMSEHMEKATMHAGKAEYYEERVRQMENYEAILPDDPLAINKYESKIEQLTKLRNAYKQFNQDARRLGLEAALGNFPGDREHLRWLLTAIWRDKKIPSYALSSLSTKVREAKRRLIFHQQKPTYKQIKFEGGKAELTDGYWNITFDFIPAPELRSVLKRWPLSLKWSPTRKAWVRRHTESTNQFFEEKLTNLLGAPQEGLSEGGLSE